MFLIVWVAWYDLWCAVRILKMLLWLEEWFDISQKMVERSLIVIYVVIFNWQSVPQAGSHWSLLGRAMASVGMGFLLWTMHRKPEALRRVPLDLPIYAIRGLLQVAMLAVGALPLFIPPRRLADVMFLALNVTYLLLMYITSISTNGTRGSRRKLAIEKLKELFGALDWLPKPAPSEG